MAHAGVLKALDELNIPVCCISGTSSGAMVAVLYAAGIKPEAMIGIMNKSKLFKIGGLSFDMRGLLKTTPFKKMILDNLKIKNFEELNIPVTVCLTDFTNGLTLYYDKGPLLAPMTASCSIPLIFSPVHLEGNMMVDGGLLNNFPIEPIREKCDYIIGVHVNPLGPFKGVRFKGLLERCFQMAIMSATKTKAGMCDLYMEPEALSKYSVFDTKHVRDIFNIGYKATMENKDSLLKMIQ